MTSYPIESALGAFALYFESPQVWVEDERAKTNPSLQFEIAFDRIGSRDVPILLRRDGFLIFRFDKAPPTRVAPFPRMKRSSVGPATRR